VALRRSLPNTAIDTACRRFRVLGEPMRIRLLERLRCGEATVTELTQAPGGSGQNVSKHLSVLLEAGIIDRRKQGTASIYRISDETVFELYEWVWESIEREAAALGELIAAAQP